MAGRVLLIEGLDLAGKSTLVENLRRELADRSIPVRRQPQRALSRQPHRCLGGSVAA